MTGRERLLTTNYKVSSRRDRTDSRHGVPLTLVRWLYAVAAGLVASTATGLCRSAEADRMLLSGSDWFVRLPHVGIIPAIDLGETDNIHPRRKAEVGHRLAMLAEAKIYNLAVDYSGPIYVSSVIDANRIRLTFDHAAGMRSSGSVGSTGFAIAGEDHRFYGANAEIEENLIIVSSPLLQKPVAARYAWVDSPIAVLVNGVGLPAFPFRTDQRPGLTSGRR